MIIISYERISKIKDPNLTITYLPTNTEAFIYFSARYKVRSYINIQGKEANK